LSIHVALNPVTHYRYDRRVNFGDVRYLMRMELPEG